MAKTRRKRTPLREGDCFAVPVDDGGYGMVVLARVPDDGSVLGYFFGPWSEDIPSGSHINSLKPTKAICIWKVSEVGLEEGRWPKIGAFEDWDRASWPVPLFYSEGYSYLRGYNDNLDCISERRIPRREGRSYEPDLSRGHLAAGYQLSLKLQGLEGTYAFASQEAFDWIYELIDNSSLNFLAVTLNEVLEAIGTITYATASRGLAAVEVVAAMHVRRRLPDDLHEWMDDHFDWDVSELLRPAILVVDRVLSDGCELSQRWARLPNASGKWKEYLQTLQDCLPCIEAGIDSKSIQPGLPTEATKPNVDFVETSPASPSSWTFGEDAAMDWLTELQDLGVIAIGDALAQIAAIDDYMETDICSHALAACEVVAALAGAPSDSLPEDVESWISINANIDPAELAAAAIHAIDRIESDDSELKDRGEESDSQPMWLAHLQDLRKRLSDIGDAEA